MGYVFDILFCGLHWSSGTLLFYKIRTKVSNKPRLNWSRNNFIFGFRIRKLHHVCLNMIVMCVNAAWSNLHNDWICACFQVPAMYSGGAHEYERLVKTDVLVMRARSSQHKKPRAVLIAPQLILAYAASCVPACRLSSSAHRSLGLFY